MEESGCGCTPEKEGSIETGGCCEPSVKPSGRAGLTSMISGITRIEASPSEGIASCPPSADDSEGCTPSGVAVSTPPGERPGIRVWPFVERWMDTPAGVVPIAKTELEKDDHIGRWLVRWGIGRAGYRIAPGLYGLGAPDRESPVIVTANYKFSFDALRSNLDGVNCWVVVLETFGINVWCAAGKGTFSTDEIVRRVKSIGLERVVDHRTLIVPQLGAPGVAAHKVRAGCGFSVKYGTIRAEDMKSFLENGMVATPEMRRVTFTTMERLVLTPVEITMLMKPFGLAFLVIIALSGIGPSIFSPVAAFTRGVWGASALALGILSGAVLTPVLLPWIPTATFSAKGAIVGGGVTLVASLIFGGGAWFTSILAAFLFIPAVSSYVAMNFTGASTFTSPSGVEREMRKSLPFQAGAAVLAGIMWLVSAF